MRLTDNSVKLHKDLINPCLIAEVLTDIQQKHQYISQGIIVKVCNRQTDYNVVRNALISAAHIGDGRQKMEREARETRRVTYTRQALTAVRRTHQSASLISGRRQTDTRPAVITRRQSAHVCHVALPPAQYICREL